MSRLVDDLLDVSRISRGQIGLPREPCDFAAIARQTVDDYRAILESTGLELILDVPSHPVWVIGDCTRLAQSISNLLQNTGKFTSLGDTVTVKLVDVPDEHCAVLSVRDTGIGMESDFLARIFEPFRQFDPGVGRRQGGLGIGLSLVKGLIELHGGEVHARSEGLRHGSEITIRLPTHNLLISLTCLPHRAKLMLIRRAVIVFWSSMTTPWQLVRCRFFSRTKDMRSSLRL